MKSNTKKRQAEQEITKWINQERLISISKGFQGMAQIVIDEIDKGSDIQKIKEICEWYISNSDKAVEKTIT